MDIQHFYLHLFENPDMYLESISLFPLLCFRKHLPIFDWSVHTSHLVLVLQNSQHSDAVSTLSLYIKMKPLYVVSSSMLEHILAKIKLVKLQHDELYFF